MSLFSFHYPSLYSAFFYYWLYSQLCTVKYNCCSGVCLGRIFSLSCSMCLIVHRKGNRILKQNFDMAVRVRVSMVNKDERNYVITLDKEKSTCTLVRFFILPTRLKFNYHQFCFNITRYNHYTFGASSLFLNRFEFFNLF